MTNNQKNDLVELCDEIIRLYPTIKLENFKLKIIRSAPSWVYYEIRNCKKFYVPVLELITKFYNEKKMLEEWNKKISQT